MRPGLVLASLVSLAALSSLPSSAHAEGLAPALVRLLHVPGHPHPLADASGRVPISVALPPGVDAAALGLLPVAPGIGAVRLPPEKVGAFAAAHPGLAIGVAPRLRPLLDVSPQWTHVDRFRAATGGLEGKGVVVGVVDTGLDVEHPDFRDAKGHTRVAWMLVGGAPAGLHPDLEKRYGCTDENQSPCAIYARADIDAMIAAGKGPGDADGHGTHVTSIAAGNGGPSVTPTPRYVGLAPEATIIVAAPDSSQGFHDVDILNSARFVFDMATSLCEPGKADPSCGTSASPPPVVVNVSLGSDYGPHDGTSTIEKGLSAFVGDAFPGRAIAVAAGNSGEISAPGDGTLPLCTGDGWLCGVHTEVHVAPGEETRVPIVAGAATDGQGYVWVTLLPGDDVEVGLEGPGGSEWVGYTGRADQGSYTDGSGTSANTGVVVNDLPSADPDLNPVTNSAVAIFTGHWAQGSEFAILLRGSGTASLWVEGEGDAQQALYFEKALRQGTINVPASAPGLLAVGCTVNRVEWAPFGGLPLQLGMLGTDMSPVADSACYFSADGPTPLGVQKPEISAPGGFVGAAMSAQADPRKAAPGTSGGLFQIQGCPPTVPDCAVLDQYHALAAGTSMSAPHVAGAIALLMEIDPTLTQARVTEVLQAGARLSHGHIPDPDQLGPGSLDLEGAREALVERMWEPAAPDLIHSWWTLSAAYARPDPTWPVWGTVELRHGDGTLAGGVDGTQLSLSLQGGKVYQPLIRVRPGLWRFAVAGTSADLGGSIAVGITYAGKPIGAPQTLPVGNDFWSASDPSVSAVSACAAGPRGLGSRGLAGLGIVALAGAAADVRRRRGRRR